MPYTPQQNGVSERMNRTLLDKARCLLIDSELSEEFWAEAVNTAIYLRNRLPCRAIDFEIPEEKWSGRKVGLSHIRRFGCLAYGLVPDEKRSKFEPPGEPHILVGYTETSKVYRLFDVKRRKIQEMSSSMKEHAINPNLMMISRQIAVTFLLCLISRMTQNTRRMSRRILAHHHIQTTLRSFHQKCLTRHLTQTT